MASVSAADRKAAREAMAEARKHLDAALDRIGGKVVHKPDHPDADHRARTWIMEAQYATDHATTELTPPDNASNR